MSCIDSLNSKFNSVKGNYTIYQLKHTIQNSLKKIKTARLLCTSEIIQE